MSTGGREDARLTADVVALAFPGGVPHVLLIRRAWDPFAGLWALPGGHVDPDEDVADAARRELAEETGIVAGTLTLVGVYAAPGRDPRGRYATWAYVTHCPRMPTPTADDDADAARWVPVAEALADGLAFDHGQIVTDATSTPAALVAVAEALENLAGRVSRSLDLEASESTALDADEWQDAAAGVVDYAAACLAVLERPDIAAALTLADARRQAGPAGQAVSA